MRHTGTYCPSNVDVSDYDVDHVINDVNKKVNDILDHADFGDDNIVKHRNERAVCLAVINSMTERLRTL